MLDASPRLYRPHARTPNQPGMVRKIEESEDDADEGEDLLHARQLVT
jgi:hypothetical protein